ncbi:MAG TPA: hypothetical protein VI978_02895 [Candidatus Paceibacterota bacterium]
MNLDEIKKIVKDLGSAIIFDQDGPKVVCLSYEKFSEMFGQNQNREPEQKIRLNLYENAYKNDTSDIEVIERLNQDIAILKEEIRKKELQEMGEE